VGGLEALHLLVKALAEASLGRRLRTLGQGSELIGERAEVLAGALVERARRSDLAVKILEELLQSIVVHGVK
jgi:hypothetical protein